ncbi:MAG: glycosyltransferase family 4 protein, partial [Patescibacteria group bacterium]|nr:glycosyltransferase family 4 protein [Patescibacteria group bacterium]
PMICAITDLGYLKNPEQFSKKDYWQLKYWSAISMFLAKKIIAISKSTAKDIVRQYSFFRNKVSVTYLGYDKDQFNLNISQNLVRRTISKLNLPKDYILYIGLLKPSKNLEGLIEGFSLLKNKYYGINLVVAGKKGWLYETIFEKVKKLNLKERVIFTDYIKEEYKAPLLKGAKAFVLPSFWEGFGIDVLSAFAVGTPVIISNVGSLPEVGGDAAIYINPYDPESIAKSIDYVLGLPQREYNSLVKKGLNQVSRFSWDKTARETLNIMTEAIFSK